MGDSRQGFRRVSVVRSHENHPLSYSQSSGLSANSK